GPISVLHVMTILWQACGTRCTSPLTELSSKGYYTQRTVPGSYQQLAQGHEAAEPLLVLDAELALGTLISGCRENSLPLVLSAARCAKHLGLQHGYDGPVVMVTDHAVVRKFVAAGFVKNVTAYKTIPHHFESAHGAIEGAVTTVSDLVVLAHAKCQVGACLCVVNSLSAGSSYQHQTRRISCSAQSSCWANATSVPAAADAKDGLRSQRPTQLAHYALHCFTPMCGIVLVVVLVHRLQVAAGCRCVAVHEQQQQQAAVHVTKCAACVLVHEQQQQQAVQRAAVHGQQQQQVVGVLQVDGKDVLVDIGLVQFDSPSTPNRLTSAAAGRGRYKDVMLVSVVERGPAAKDLHALVAPTVDDAIRAAITNHKALVAAAGSDFDVLLGNDWLNEHEAVMSYQDKTLSLACDKSEPVVLPCPSAGVSQSGQSAVSNPASFLVNALRAKPPLASAKVAARWLRKGGTGVLALITVDNSSTPDPAPAEPDLPPGVSQALNALLDEYADVFAPITSLPPERPVGHAIPLVPDARPSVVPQYRMSQEEHAELKKQVQDLLAKGMIEPSSSPFAAPILFVKKKSGELRMCLDYRQLNKITIRDQYPLPRIDDLFDKLSGCTVFSSLDLQAGYNQIRITPEDVPKTAFRTPDGHYQFKVLSFGLCNAPATFQRVMNDAFAPVLNQCALVYLDDILVMSKSVDEHLKHLRKVFDLLRLNKLFAKQSKCEFMRTTLKFLGHVIFAGAIAVDPEKIKSISSWPVPQSLQQLQSFLGVGAVLMQDGYPLAYLSKKLSSAERNYTTGEQELLALITACKEWRLSKMVHFVPCKESMNAKGFARLFVDNVFKLHGLPKDMVSDRGPHFHNTFWHHVQKLLGMRGSLSSSYHPQSDGQTERYNRVLEEMLRHYISPTQADWPDYLSLAEFAVNNSWQESIKSTPFLVNTGQSPITPMLHSLPDKGRCPEGLSYATWWQEAVAKAKLCMQAAQQRQAAYANQDRRDVHYKVGQMVLLSTKNMRLKPGKARKLLPRFVGPFKVLDLVGQVAVNLQLPASMSRLHPVFHVSLIKPYTGTDVGFMPPPVEWLDEEPVYYVERLLDHRHVHAGKAKEYLVQWEGYDADHNTWEPRSNLVGCDKILAEYNAAHNLKFFHLHLHLAVVMFWRALPCPVVPCLMLARSWASVGSATWHTGGRATSVSRMHM
ncbi:hypothetical protein QJQ45_021328, partial [Haematococcus lacustris]